MPCPERKSGRKKKWNAVKSSVAAAASYWESQTADFVPGAQLKITPKYLTEYGYARDDIAVEQLVVADAVMTPGGIPLDPEKQGWINEVMAGVHLQIPGEEPRITTPLIMERTCYNFNNDDSLPQQHQLVGNDILCP